MVQAVCTNNRSDALLSRTDPSVATVAREVDSHHCHSGTINNRSTAPYVDTDNFHTILRSNNLIHWSHQFSLAANSQNRLEKIQQADSDEETHL